MEGCIQRFPFSRRDSSDIRGSRFPDVLDTLSFLAAKIYPCARCHRPHRWCVECVGLASDAPIKRHGLIACVLLALVLPAMIYAYFILHGGQRVAFNRSFSKSAPCPFCRNPVRTLSYDVQGAPTTQFAESVCPHCSHTLS